MWLSRTPICIGTGECGGDCYRELRRILIPRTSVNKGKKKRKGPGSFLTSERTPS